MSSYLNPHNRRHWIILTLLLLFGLLSPLAAQEAIRLPISASDTDGHVELVWLDSLGDPKLLVDDRVDLASFEAEVVALVNDARAQYGLHPLVTNAALTSAARKHSQDMADNDFFSHVGSDGSGFVTRLQREGYVNLCAGGENIAAGQTLPEAVVSAWMNSPGHRANILNAKFRDIGVGYIYEPDDTFPSGWGYRHYWTQDFGSTDCYGPTPTLAKVATPTSTPVPTSRSTLTPTNTRTPTATHTNTWTVTRTATMTPTPTSVATWTPTATRTYTPTRRNTATPTWTQTATTTRPPASTPTPTRTMTVMGATLAGSVDLQGRPSKPSVCWAVPLAVTMYRQDGSIYHMVPLQTTAYGEFVMPNLEPGVYDIRLKNPLTLANVKTQVELRSGLNQVAFGTLVSGDCSDDNVIDVLDFSLLRSAFGTDNQVADLNNDGFVDVFDFSLLRTHFGMSGDIEID